jgi:DNA-binding NarL/FixJ family response regulator
VAKIRVLIADDHTVVRDGLSSMLARETDFEVVGEAADGEAAVRLAARLQPDVILMDLRMPVLDGAEAMRRIREAQPEVKFLVLTTFDTDEYVFQAIEAGARGYLLKDSSREDLFRAVRAVHAGESLIQPAVAARVLDRFAQMSRTSREQEADRLSSRELVVLEQLARGLANKQIAAQLSVSENTVKTHVASIFQKLGVNDRTGAVTAALQRGLIRL